MKISHHYHDVTRLAKTIRKSFVVAVLIFFTIAEGVCAATLQHAWVELVSDRKHPLELRVVLPKSGPCPTSTVDNNKLIMHSSQGTIGGYKVCYLPLRGTEQVFIGKYRWNLKNLNRVLVVPSWFAVSTSDRSDFVLAVRKQRPDLVIFMGSYLSPAELKQGWSSWSRNFFDYWQPLLASVPVLFVRGKYESCSPASDGLWNILQPFSLASNCIDGSGTWAVRWSNFYALVLDDITENPSSFGKHSLLAEIERYHMDTINPHPWVISPRPIFCMQHIFKNLHTCSDKKLRSNLESWLTRNTSLIMAADDFVSRVEQFDGLPLQLVLAHRGRRVKNGDFHPEGISDVEMNKIYASPDTGFAVLDYHDELVKNSHWDVRWFNSSLRMYESCFLKIRKVVCSGDFFSKIISPKKY